METLDAVVVGAGVVGLAVARALALQGREVMVLETEPGIGMGVSSRSSEVIHAGLYYPTGSAKARLCVQGRDLLYTYCAERGVAHQRCGKVVVASHADQLPALSQLQAQALANGVTDVKWLSAEEVHALEPELNAVAGLWSPSTGIIDSHGFMLSLQSDAEAAGAMLVFHHRVLSVQHRPQGGQGLSLTVHSSAGETSRWHARTLVNAGGLHAVALARATSAAQHPPAQQAYLAKGHYFSLQGKSPFSHLVYPLPEPGGLGIHLTLDLQGRARFGPDVAWLNEVDYRPDPSRQAAFEAAIRRYWPGLPDQALNPDYTGIRPKISGPGEPNADFLVWGPAQHGVPGLVHLLGIESPGLTSALALAQEVAGQL